ncbi:MAG: hypothetical protein P4L35_13535 [Ignavibacteriaceae bacterium]|nr:hypothetical protein [Ignavibacteriaceae bacterium]
MNTEYPWIKIIEQDEDKVPDIPFFPQEYEEDKDDFEEWELLLD